MYLGVADGARTHDNRNHKLRCRSSIGAGWRGSRGNFGPHSTLASMRVAEPPFPRIRGSAGARRGFGRTLGGGGRVGVHVGQGTELQLEVRGVVRAQVVEGEALGHTRSWRPVPCP